MKELTEKEKQEAVEATTGKIASILAINGISLTELSAKMLASVVMIYQQGLKDAKDLFTSLE